jgi:hydroxymethylbilane synthase
MSEDAAAPFPNTPNMILKIGTRGSTLALAQARWVQEKIAGSGVGAELMIIKTSGDRFIDRAVQSVGGKGIFVKEIEDALLNDEIDLAVHSMKDLPAELPPELVIAAVPVREDARDVLVSREGMGLEKLPKGATIATGSLRRRAQILYYRPDLNVMPIRGNVDTRLKKLAVGDFQALVLAAAGLKRIGREDGISEYLGPDVCLSAVAQGALAIQTKVDRPARASVVFMNHRLSYLEVLAERAFLQRLGGGCQVPVGARAVATDDRIELAGMVADPDGRRLCRGKISGSSDAAAAIGNELAERLLTQGAGDLLAGSLTDH